MSVFLLGFLSACGGDRARLEACSFVEIEDAEVEVDLGDVDIERGEVEMVCGDKIVDVTWGEFKQQLRIDPGQYKTNLEAFKQQVQCSIEEGSRRQQVLCTSSAIGNQFVGLNFSDDD
ncbi:MAG: hypothetical protein SWY16_02760 [Cyanobacteriota bacterium]|nr:hypothetical protein [Cyanobacteriota bacterium]